MPPDGFDLAAALGASAAPSQPDAAPPTAAAPATAPDPSQVPQPFPGGGGVLPDGSATHDPAVWARWLNDLGPGTQEGGAWGAKVPPAPPTAGDSAAPSPGANATAPGASASKAASSGPALGAMAAKDFDLAKALGAEPAPNPAPAAASAAVPTPGQPGQKLSGGMANLAAGGNEALAGFLGSPVDLATGALNLPARAINAVAGTSLPMITNPMGGQNWWESAMGLIGADPRNVVADGQGDRLIRGIGAGAVGAVLPGAPAREIAAGALGAGELARGVASALGSGSMAGNAALGATSGYIGQAADDATTDPRWKPLANMLGQVAGGAGAALTGAGLTGAYRAATGAAGRLAETLPIGAKTPLLDDTGAPVIGTDGQPVMMTQGQAQAATRGVAQAAGMSAPDLAASIPTEAPAVLGDRPTVGQLTGNMRVLGLERKLKTLNREPFNEREASNNTARTAALADLSHPDTQGDAAGQFFVNTLQKIDEAGAAREAAAAQAAQAATSGLGGTASAAELGQAMRGHVEQRFAPVMQTADRAVQEAERRVGATAASVGGERVGTPAATASEQIGAETRAALDKAHQDDDARITRLFDAVDPDKKLALSLQSYRAAAKQMRDDILPGGSGGLSPSEEAVISAAEKAPPVQTFAWVQQERRNINNHVAMARRAGDNNAARRLDTVRRGLDADIDAAVADQVRQEAPFVVSGQIPAEKSMLGRLAAEAASWRQRRASEAAASGGGEPGAGYTPPGGTPGLPELGGTAGSGSPRPGNATVNSGVAVGQADQQLAPNLAQSDRAAMRLANSEFAKHQGIFAEGAIADILEKNPRNGGRFEMPDARVVEKLFPGGTMEAKNAHALVAAVGQERASQVAGHALAFNLRSYAARDGAFDSKRLSDWMARHTEALTVFPELRQRFGTLQRAQQTLDGIRDARAQLEKLNPIKPGSTNADVAAQYWRPGPQGTEAVQRFARDTGPQAAQVLHDAAASSLRQSFKNGEFSEATFQSWKKSFGPALAELPADVRAKFDTFASAQRDLAESAAARKAAVDEYQKGVAQFYLGKDPQKAVESVMGSANPQLNALRLMQATAGDKAAQDSIRKNVADWLIAKTKSTAEAGTTDDKKIAGGVFQRTISNPKIAAALERVFTPDQMEAIRAVGASIARQDRSINATAIAGSPGTAADLHAAGGHGNSSFVDLFLGAGLGEAAAHLSGAGGVVGTAMGAAGVAGAHALRMMRAAGLTTVQDIQRAILLNPELARVMLAKVPTSENVPIMRKLSAALATLATSGVSRNANGDPRP